MNPWEIVGSGLRQTAGDLGQFQKSRQAYQEAVLRRAESIRAARLEEEKRIRESKLEEERRTREQAAEKRAAEEHARKQKEIPEWKPTTQEEKEAWYRKQKEIDNELQPRKGPTDSEKSRAFTRENAKKLLPATWMALDKLWGQKPKQTPDMLPADFAKAEGDWKNRMDSTRKRIQELQTQAGEDITSDPFSTEREQSPSWLDYAEEAYPGKYPASPGGQTPMQRPAAQPAMPITKPMDEITAAMDWLQKNPSHPMAESVKAKIDALRASRGAGGF